MRVLGEYRSVGKKGGTKVDRIIGHEDGSVEIKQMGRGNVLIDPELVRFLFSRDVVSNVRGLFKDVRKARKARLNLTSRRRLSKAKVRRPQLNASNATAIALVEPNFNGLPSAGIELLVPRDDNA